MHETVRPVLDAVDSAGGNSVTGFVALHLHRLAFAAATRAWAEVRGIAGSQHPCTHDGLPNRLHLVMDAEIQNRGPISQ